MKHTTYILLSLLGIAVLTACGPEDDTASIAGGGRGGDSIGFLTLSITDAPVDGAAQVWVQIDGVTLQHEAESEPTVMPFDPPKRIDLLTLQGQISTPLLENKAIQSGNYNWIRLNITASDDGVLDSYIMLKDGTVHDLDIPSGSETGLKINKGPLVIANTLTTMTVDFDLTNSILLEKGEYKLKPVLRLVHDELTSSITGILTGNVNKLLTDDCSDMDPDTGNAVYLYEGFNATPDDFDSTTTGGPFDKALVTMNTSGKYEYEFGFIPFGEYTAVFTCWADKDDVDTDDASVVFSNNARDVSLSKSSRVINLR